MFGGLLLLLQRSEAGGHGSHCGSLSSVVGDCWWQKIIMASETFCDAHKFLCDAHIFFVSAHKTIFVSVKCSQKKCERSQNKIVSTHENSGKRYFYQ